MINRLKTPAQVDICKDRWDRNPKKDSKDLLEMKNTVLEMRNAFHRLLSRLGMAEEDSQS
jgi:hypothetical protein